jgi:hypothetical protein
MALKSRPEREENKRPEAGDYDGIVYFHSRINILE